MGRREGDSRHRRDSNGKICGGRPWEDRIALDETNWLPRGATSLVFGGRLASHTSPYQGHDAEPTHRGTVRFVGMISHRQLFTVSSTFISTFRHALPPRASFQVQGESLRLPDRLGEQEMARRCPRVRTYPHCTSGGDPRRTDSYCLAQIMGRD